MGVETGTAILLASLIGGGAAIGSSMMNKPSKPQSPSALPQAPTPDASADKGSAIANAKRMAATKSIFSSPLGIEGQADITRKTLLGL